MVTETNIFTPYLLQNTQDVEAIVRAFDCDEHKVFAGLHLKYNTLPIRVCIEGRKVRNSAVFYKVRTHVNVGPDAATYTCDRRYNDFYQLNEMLKEEVLQYCWACMLLSRAQYRNNAPLRNVARNIHRLVGAYGMK